MGLISGAIDAALESIGKSLLDVGEWFLETGYTLWKNAGKLTLDYVKISPMSQSGAWGVVTGSVYQMSLAIAASLAVLFFVMGWLRESIDIRNNFTLENMFRFFVRYAITASLIVNSLSLVTGICECATAVTSQISVNMESKDVENVFETVRDQLEDDDDEDGGTWIGMGLAGMLGGFFGGAVIMVCGVSLVLSVLSRLFKLLLCEPGTCLILGSVYDNVKAHRRNKALTDQIAFLALVIFGYVNDHYNVAVAANEISDFQLADGNNLRFILQGDRSCIIHDLFEVVAILLLAVIGNGCWYFH
jgi:hypothetical protein